MTSPITSPVPNPKDVVILQRSNDGSSYGEIHISGSKLILHIDSAGYLNADLSSSFYSQYPPPEAGGLTPGNTYPITASWAVSSSWASQSIHAQSASWAPPGPPSDFSVSSSWASQSLAATSASWASASLTSSYAVFWNSSSLVDYIESLLKQSTYYLTATSSLVSTYYIMRETGSSATTTTLVTGSITNGNYVFNWITPPGVPNSTIFPEGVYQADFVASIDNATGITTLTPELYIADSAGTIYYELPSGQASGDMTTSPLRYQLSIIVDSPVTMSATDRLVMKLLCTTDTAGKTFSVQVEGNVLSHLTTPFGTTTTNIASASFANYASSAGTAGTSTSSSWASASIFSSVSSRSLFATSASWASSSLSALTAISASWASQSFVAISSSWASASLFSSISSQSFSATSASWASQSLVALVSSRSLIATSASWASSSMVAISSSWASSSISASFLNGPHSGSTFGTASWAYSASVAISASWAPPSTAGGAISSSWASQSLNSVSSSWASSSLTSSYLDGTASFAVSASWAPPMSSGVAVSASWASQSLSASHVIGGVGTTLYTASTYQITSSQAETSSWSVSASWAPPELFTASLYQITSSQAISASWAPPSPATYTSSLWGTASWAQSSSWAESASWAPGGSPPTYTSSLWGTASWAESASWAPSIPSDVAVSASWASSSISSSYLFGPHSGSTFGTASWSVSASWAPGAAPSTPQGRSVMLCAAYTPTVSGSDSAEVVVPYSPADGTTNINWVVRRLVWRTQTAETLVPSASVRIEKSTGAGLFTAVTVGEIGLISGSYEGITTGSLGNVDSGDKLRFSVYALGAAVNWTIITEISDS